MSNTATESDTDIVKLTLRELGTRAGMALQVRRLKEGAVKKEAQLFGAIENKGVMVGPQGPEGEETGLDTDDVCIVRGFTGQHEFSFISKVLQTFEKPFVYALLAYPAQVDARLVRKSMRTRTSWPVTAQADGLSVQATLVDISMQGAMISAASSLAIAGAPLAISIQAVLEGEASTLNLKAVVCHSHKAKSGDQHFVGMAFQGLTREEKLVLHYLTTKPQN